MQHLTLTFPLMMSTVLSPDTSSTLVRAWRSGTASIRSQRHLCDLAQARCLLVQSGQMELLRAVIISILQRFVFLRQP
ncbi:hypothetical protein SY26_06035 [Paracoccus sp. 228]|nr:hypothetical protein SY26_06035 [Paracoccus sp. 228]